MVNLLAGRVPLGAAPETDAGILDALSVSRIPCFGHNRRPVHRNERTGSCCAMVGYVANLAEVAGRHGVAAEHDVEVVEALFARGGLDLLGELDGMFSVFLLDAARRTVYLLQDELASNLPLYYAHTAGELVFGTSLRRVLTSLPFARELDLHGARDYLYNGLVVANVVPSERTLVRNVFKLPPGRVLAVDLGRGSVAVRPLVRRHRRCGAGEARRQLLPLIDAAVEAHATGLLSPGVALALSGGYDTNYVLHRLRSAGRVDITAFTIGGRKVNEIPQAAAVARHHGDVRHVTATVGEAKLERLPDIVWRLEGYVFQSGVFLQHELAGLVARTGPTSLLVAEGADQYLNSRFHLRLIREARRSLAWVIARRLYVTRAAGYRWSDRLRLARLVRHLWWGASRRGAYYIMLDGILKKSGIMLNSAGVQGLYPFLARPVRDAAVAIGLRASYKKAYYRARVGEAVGPVVAAALKKTGGTTDVEFLFHDRLPQMIAALRCSPLVDALLPRGGVDEIARRPDLHWHMAAELLTLDLFADLFLSGDYDASFERPGLDLPLGDWLAERGARAPRP